MRRAAPMGAYGRREYSFLFLLVVFVIRQSECNPYRLGRFNATGLNYKVNATSRFAASRIYFVLSDRCIAMHYCGGKIKKYGIIHHIIWSIKENFSDDIEIYVDFGDSGVLLGGIWRPGERHSAFTEFKGVRVA